MTFSKSDNDNSSTVAKAIVKLERLKEVPKDKMRSSPFKLSLGSLNLVHKSKYLGKGIFRVTISLDPKVIPKKKEAQKIFWSYSDGESNGRFTTSYSLE